MKIVAEKNNGVDALCWLGQNECDVVLLDISMPGKGGIDVLKQVHDEKPNLPILILSNYPEDQAHGVLIFRVIAENQDRQIRFFIMNLLEDINSAFAGHGNIEQHQVTFVLPKPIQCVNTVILFRNDFHAWGFLKDSIQPMAHNIVIIDDQNAYHVLSNLWLSAGISSVNITLKPPPGRL